jgi:hypothetical protein
VVVFNGTEYALGTAIATGEGTLTVNANGTWSFVSSDNIAQPASLSFDVKVTDGDGDHASDTQTITINDGAGPGDGGTVGLTLSEAALDTTKDGSDLAAGTVTGSDPSSTGETQVVAPASGLAFTAGSDDLSSVAFNATQSGIVVTGLTTGYSLTWSVVSGELIGTLHVLATPILARR